MIMELLILLTTFSLLYVAVPALVTGKHHGSLLFRAAAGFIALSLSLRIAVMFVGLAGAAFHGIVLAVWACCVSGLFLASQDWSFEGIAAKGRGAFLAVLRAFESESVGWRPRWPAVSRAAVLFCLLIAVTMLHRAWFPLHNLRFATIEAYSRALNLERFVQRDSPVAGGVELILAPLSVASGLYADSVIRFSGPLFSILLVAAVGLCAFRIAGASSAPVAAALMALRPVVLGTEPPGEISNAEFAAVYWILGAAFIGRSAWIAVSAFATALLISFSISSAVPVAIICIAAAYALAKLAAAIPARLALAPSGFAAFAAMFLLLIDCRSVAADGPYEYESAARASRAIATQFPKREWMIVSPGHELIFTYGRGWHYELLDFVSSLTPRQIMPREFVFPYDVREIFVFVEKDPLRPSRPGITPADPAALDLTGTMDRAVLAYSTGLGRASIEFQAGALITAYAVNHPEISIFFEDDRLVVFHLKGKRALAQMGA